LCLEIDINYTNIILLVDGVTVLPNNSIRMELPSHVMLFIASGSAVHLWAVLHTLSEILS